MLFVKDKIEKETDEMIAAFKKNAEHEVWSKMAAAMVEIGGDSYSSGAVEKAFTKERKEGFPHKATVAAVVGKSVSNVDTDEENEVGEEADAS